MPRIELMSWQSRQRRWIKKHRSKQYAVSCRQLGTEPTREASRALANEWWQTKRAELDRNHFESSGSRIAWNALSETLSNAAEIAKRNRYLPQLASVQTEQAIVSRLTAELSEFPAIRDEHDNEQADLQSIHDILYEAPANEAPATTLRMDKLAILESRRQRALGALAAKLTDTGGIAVTALPMPARRRMLRETIDAFLADKFSEVKRSKLSAGRHDVIARAIKHLEAWLVDSAGKATAADIETNNVDGSTLPGYLAHVETDQQAKGWSDSFASSTFVVARQFVQWAYMREHLQSLPRNYHDRKLRVSVANARPIALSVDAAKLLLTTDNEHFKLYVLLALNVAATQVDIADLQNQQVDWEARRICRKR